MTLMLRSLSAELLGDDRPPGSAPPADGALAERLLAEVRALRREVAALREEVDRSRERHDALTNVIGAVEADVSRLAAPLAAFQRRLVALGGTYARNG